MSSIVCDVCEVAFKYADDTTPHQEAARLNGWIIWSGQTIGGADLRIRVCSRCRDDKRRGTKIEGAAPPEGSQPLF